MITKNKKIICFLVAVITVLSVSMNAFAWTKDMWNTIPDNGSSQGTGHKSMILKIGASIGNVNFKCPASTDTDTDNHRNIVAEAARLTDALDCMSAENGNTVNLSPYHAKAQLDGTTGSSGYSLATVRDQHLKFLYELARRRLVLGSKLDLISSNYTADTYYGVTINLAMKRRIVDDLTVLNAQLVAEGYDMTKVDHQGYMVLGVFFHLLEDIYAHRAKVTKDMVSSTSNANYIKAADFTSTTVRSNLLTLLSSTSIPMIRLKDYLKSDSSLSASYTNGTMTGLSAASAYEDNPFYYSSRYSAAYNATVSQLSKIMADTDSDDATDFSFTTYSNVPLM